MKVLSGNYDNINNGTQNAYNKDNFIDAFKYTSL